MTLHQVQPSWELLLLDWAEKALESHHHPIEMRAEAGALDAAYRHCAALTHFHSRTFYIASSLLPREKRRAVRALYAFCRVTDDVVDEAETSDPAEVLAGLNEWRRISLHSRPQPYQPVALAWADARARYSIPCGYAEQLIDGVARDLEQKTYATFDDLAAYSYGVASTVGLMAMYIIGFEGPRALPYAVKLGVALQLTNILRDVAADWRKGRLYLPADELAAFGLSDGYIADNIARVDDGHDVRIDARWREFMRFQIERTRHLYDEGAQGIGLLNPEGRFAIAAAADLYRAILNDIEAHDYDVFSRRAHVSTSGKLRLLPGIWWRSRRAKIDD